MRDDGDADARGADAERASKGSIVITVGILPDQISSIMGGAAEVEGANNTIKLFRKRGFRRWPFRFRLHAMFHARGRCFA